MCLKNAIFVLEFSEDMCLVKNGSNMYLGDEEAKELTIICDHVHFSRKNEWTQDCSSLLKGRGRGQKLCDTDTGSARSMKRFAFYHGCMPSTINRLWRIKALQGELIRGEAVFQSDLNCHYNRLFTSEACD